MGDLALNEWSVRPIGGDPFRLGLFGSGVLKNRLVLVDRHRAAGSRRRAGSSQGTGSTVRGEAGKATAVTSPGDDRDLSCRAGDGVRIEVDDEAILGEATGRVADRRALGHEREARFAEFFSCLAVGIGGVTEDRRLVVIGFSGEQVGNGLRVVGVRRGGDDFRDQLGVRVDREVCLLCASPSYVGSDAATRRFS